jgi:two-component system chemotaxis sensor kinase CheA
MDMNRFRALFLAEAREHVSLAFALEARLERSLGDTAALRELLRHAHSLKGLAATMGYEPMVELAHALEEAMTRLGRSRPADADPSLPLVGRALAGLGEMLDGIERDGRPNAPAAPELIAALRARAAAPPPAPAAAPALPAGEPLLCPEGSAPVAWRVDLELAGEPARSVPRTLSVLARAARCGRVLQVDPPRRSLASGDFEGRLGLVLWSSAPAPALRAALSGIDGVREARLAALPPLPAARDPGADASWVRVRVDRLEAVAEQLASLRKDHGRLLSASSEGPLRPLLARAASRVKKAYGSVIELGLVPFETVAQRVRQAVHELAPQLGKLVRLELAGTEVRLERGVLEALSDPLLHLVRNAVDHGLETPAARRAAGKPETGTLTLRLERHGERVDLRLADDGRGIDVAAVRRRALDLGVISSDEAASLDEARTLRLVTVPGLSTSQRVTHVSGRGIGMDVVQSTIERLGGRLELDSRPGRGTEIRLVVPARAALLQALVVRSSGVLYALPVSCVRRVVRASDLASLGNAFCLFRLESRRLTPGRSAPPSAAWGPWILLLADERSGIDVDEILGPRELVVHPLPAPLNLLGRYSGSALCEDGSIAVVPDLAHG